MHSFFAATLLNVTGPTALSAHGLYKSYGDVRALTDFHTEVSPGIVLGFLGPNGAGKTTVIRLLSTILKPDQGSFQVGGVPGTQAVEVRRRIGVLPESAGYPRGQTGLEWLTYHAQLFGQPRMQATSAARRLLEEVGLAPRGSALISSYSRGMRQRLGVARALVNDPKLVILDEPTLGLDPSGQRQLLDLVKRIARDHGVAVVLSTHLLDEVEQTCDQVLILNQGRIVAQGALAEVVRRAAAPRRALVQVPVGRRDQALLLFADANLQAEAVDRGYGANLEVTMPAGVPVEESSSRLMGVFHNAGIPVLSFTLEGGRLSDAFLAVTKET